MLTAVPGTFVTCITIIYAELMYAFNDIQNIIVTYTTVIQIAVTYTAVTYTAVIHSAVIYIAVNYTWVAYKTVTYILNMFTVILNIEVYYIMSCRMQKMQPHTLPSYTLQVNCSNINYGHVQFTSVLNAEVQCILYHTMQKKEELSIIKFSKWIRVFYEKQTCKINCRVLYSWL